MNSMTDYSIERLPAEIVSGRPEPPPRKLPPKLRCVHRWIELQAERAASAVAVRSAGETLTFGLLNARANRLAHRLRAMGVGPEVLVGICADQSASTIVALLAVFKAGGAFVLIEPRSPDDWIVAMTREPGSILVLGRASALEQMPTAPARTLFLDLDSELLAYGPDANVPGGATLANLACVMSTSASSGARERRVMISHKALSNAVSWCATSYAMPRGQGVPAYTQLTSEGSAVTLLAALVAGRRVDLLEPDSSLERLANALDRSGEYSLVRITPTHLRTLGERLTTDGARGKTRAFIIGGGRARAEELAFWRRHARETALIHEYGHAETTGACCVYPVGGDGDLPSPLPIGRPIASASVYIVDPQLEPVPVGVAGELLIGGDVIARGYLDKARATAESFIPDPFGAEPGARLFRTGDLARWRIDGNLEYVGFRARGISLRAHRIQTAEIEKELARHRSVNRAVVVARDEGRPDPRLVAYLTVADNQTAPGSLELRRFLRNTLPDAMIPSAYVVLDAIPVTLDGGVDHDLLPVPEALDNRETATSSGTPPQGPVQETIAAVWGRVLGREHFGVEESFFEIGGHSLLATQVVAQLREAFSIEIPLRTLFEAPTIGELAGQIDLLRENRDASPRESSPIVPGPVAGPIPLSFSQEALWFLDQLAPGQPTFNVAAALRIKGPLDKSTFERSLDRLVARHASLRTAFVAAAGTPQQIIEPKVALSLDEIDLTGLPDQERESESRRIAVEEYRRPFDLTRAPLARATFLRLADHDCAVVLTMHHLVTDGWSFGVAAAELATLYDADRRGEQSAPPVPSIQYSDFARWQRSQLEMGAWAAAINTWRERLDGVPALELPTDRPRPPIRSARGAAHPVVLSTELSQRVRDISRREGVTPFMILLGAYQILLARWSGQEDFAVGSPVANRSRPEIAQLIGYFVNMVALRADLTGNPTVGGFLTRVRDVALEAFENQHVPLEVLVAALGGQRDASRSPFFQVMFVLQNNAIPAADPLGLVFSPINLDEGTGTSKFDLSLGFEDMPEGFIGSVEYNTDLFEPASIEQFAAQYECALEFLVADPERHLSELSLLQDAERRRVMTWSFTPPVTTKDDQAADSLAYANISAAIEAQARATPKNIALVAGNERVTYDELNARANRLARLLRSRGVKAEVRIGLVLAELLDQIVAVLGVLKAGGAYVPLDPSLPPARLDEMRQAAGVSLVIADAPSVDRVPGVDLTLIEIDAARLEIAAQSSADLEPGTEPANLAYIIFTSGSTGRPKGVMVSHESLLAAASAWEVSYDLRQPPARHLQAAGFAFDVFTGDWVRALTSGGTLVACPRRVLVDPASLTALIKRERIDCLELVPAIAEALATHLERQGEDLQGIRLLAVGSDTVRRRLFRRLCRLVGPEGRVVNSYGLTEATIDSTFWGGAVDGHEGDDGPVPIGRPFPGTRIYVLDGSGEPAPVGVVGELYIGGSGLARGYVASPRQTAERFLPDPFAANGSRMYATGDRARWRPGGVLELLGRRDGQLKVRGFRVELAEVEAALGAWPGIREAAAVPLEDETLGQRLIACLVSEAGRDIDIDALRRSLREKLPRPMIPSQFQIVESLPRTVSGKVDRRALADALPDQVSRAEAVVLPRDSVEEQLVAIWEELLPVRPIGVTDDFFDLGGHSLLAVRLAARIEERFGRSLSLSELLIGSTIEELAVRIAKPFDAHKSLPLVNLGIKGQGRPLFLVHPIGGGVLCYHDLARCFSGDRPVFAFQAAGFDGEAEPLSDLTQMAARYVDALRLAHPQGPYVLGGWSMGGLVAIEMAAQLAAAGAVVSAVVLIDCSLPAPSKGPRMLDELESLVGFAMDLARTGGGDSQTWIERLRGIDPRMLGDDTFEKTEIGRQIQSEIGAERLKQLHGLFRANRLALDSYEPRPFPGRALLFQAGSSDNNSAERTAKRWEKLALGGITMHKVAGDHYTIMQRPAAEQLAEIVRLELNRVERSDGEVKPR